MSTESFDSFDFSDADRDVVDKDKANICMGGEATGLGGLGSVEERVCRSRINMRQNTVHRTTHFATLVAH